MSSTAGNGKVYGLKKTFKCFRIGKQGAIVNELFMLTG